MKEFVTLFSQRESRLRAPDIFIVDGAQPSPSRRDADTVCFVAFRIFHVESDKCRVSKRRLAPRARCGDSSAVANSSRYVVYIFCIYNLVRIHVKGRNFSLIRVTSACVTVEIQRSIPAPELYLSRRLARGKIIYRRRNWSHHDNLFQDTISASRRRQNGDRNFLVRVRVCKRAREQARQGIRVTQNAN